MNHILSIFLCCSTYMLSCSYKLGSLQLTWLQHVLVRF